MTPDQARRLLWAHLDGGEHVRRCIDALSDPTVSSLRPAELSARDALDLWTLRSQSLSRAGVKADGLAQTLRVLAGLGHSQPVLQQTFETEDNVIVVLVSERERLVGCFIKPQRGTPGGGPPPPPLGPEFG